MDTLTAAKHELSDSEILERYGPLFVEFHEALCSDPHMLADMVERMAELRRVREERLQRGRVALSKRAAAVAARNSQIFQRHRDGVQASVIAEELSVSVSTVRKVVRTMLAEADTSP